MAMLVGKETRNKKLAYIISLKKVYKLRSNESVLRLYILLKINQKRKKQTWNQLLAISLSFAAIYVLIFYAKLKMMLHWP